MSAARFVPPVLWMAVLAVFSGRGFGADRLGPPVLAILGALLPEAGPALLHTLHVAIRKLGHLVDYAILGALWWRALAARPGPAAPGAWAIALAVAYAVADELRQGLTPNRSPATLDVVINLAGALAGVASQAGPRRLGRAVIRLGQALALALAAASLGAALLDWRLGLPAGDLLAAAAGLVVVAGGLQALARVWARAGRPEYDRPTPP